MPASGVLPKAPPTLSSPLVVTASGAMGSTTNNAGPVGTNGVKAESGANHINAGGRDVLLTAGTTCNAGLSISNYRNLVAIGITFDINQPWVNASAWTTDSRYGQPYGNLGSYVSVSSGSVKTSGYYGSRNALSLSGGSGVTHLEGLLIKGSQIIDGIKWGSLKNLVIQNCRIEVGFTNGPGSADNSTGQNPNGGAVGGFHSDCVQCFGGHVAFSMYWATLLSSYQGGMFKDDSQSYGWGTSQWKSWNGRTNPAFTPTANWLNVVQNNFGGTSLVGPHDWTNSWLVVRSGDVSFHSGGTAPWAMSLVTDAETGLQKGSFPTWPSYGGTGVAANPTGKFFTPNSFLYNGTPRPTAAFPGNPSAGAGNTFGDFVLPADVGAAYVSPGYTGIAPPPPPPPPPAGSPASLVLTSGAAFSSYE